MSSRTPADGELDIVEFTPALAGEFRRLNLEWLEAYFAVEPADRRILDDPQAEVIDRGGSILFVRLKDRIVGTVALKHHGGGNYELTKMAVTADVQGRGIGRVLLDAAIGRYRTLDGRRLFLESHSSLTAALRLYESAGFAHRPRPTASAYARADVYMEFQPSSSPAA